MSDPVKNTEVEDVLSSIRRLVSEDKRPMPAAKPVAQTDRLVLTPALRVGEESGHRADLEAEENMVDETSGAALQEDYSDNHNKFDDASDLDGESAAEAQATDTKDHDTEVQAAEDQAAESASAQALSAKIAALETAIGDIADDWEPDTAGVDDYAGAEDPAMAWEDADGDSAAPEKADEGAITDAGTLEPEPEKMAAQAADEAAETPVPQPEDITQAEMQGRHGEPDTASFATDDHLLDEDVLRDMITEIVQSELRGEMGERITRNVRRLVRREIHRALTARELD